MTISRSVVLVVFVIMANPTPSPSRAEDAPRLTKDQGPFLVLAYSFRGADAESRAEALAVELLQEHGLPTYVHENRDRMKPEHEPDVQVFVGNCTTSKQAHELMREVRKIDTKALGDDARAAGKARGLSRTIMMKNPLSELK